MANCWYVLTSAKSCSLPHSVASAFCNNLPSTCICKRSAWDWYLSSSLLLSENRGRIIDVNAILFYFFTSRTFVLKVSFFLSLARASLAAC